jgi:hypothetical protein
MNTINVKLMKDDDYSHGRSTTLTMSAKSFQALLIESRLIRVHLYTYDNSMYYYHEKLGYHIHVYLKGSKFKVVINLGYFWI